MKIDIAGYNVIIDCEDYSRIISHGWVLNNRCGKVYFCATISEISKSPVSLHRFILNCVPGDGICIDHINGNTLDNRKCNLRRTDYTGNNRNSRKPRNNTSGYKGVTKYRKQSHLYRAYIKVKYKQISLNVWDTPEKAAYVYDIASIYYFGEYAFTNFPRKNYNSIDIESELHKLTRKLPKRNTSGVVGVYYRKDIKKWAAQIGHTKRTTFLGTFDTKEEAIQARKNAEILENRINLHEQPLLEENAISKQQYKYTKNNT